VSERSGSDGQQPPIEPPAGCVNRLMWRLARRLYADHRPGPDGWCLNCRPAIEYPCVARQLADLGLARAMGQPGTAPGGHSHRANGGHRW
jgi:hypothetical protein